MIRNRSSFSFQKSRFGIGYLIKIILLTIFIVALSWYSHQEENNPFCAKERIRVLLKNEKMVIAIYPRFPKKNPLTIILPGNQLPCLDIIENANSWALISGSELQKPCNSQSAPLIWTTLDTASNSIPPHDWPSQFPIQYLKDSLKISVSRIPVFSDGTTALRFQTPKFSCLIIEGDSLSGSDIPCTLKESVDLLIIQNQNPEKIKLYRSKIRPRYLITSSQPDDILKDLSNILYFKDSPSGFEFEFIKSKKLVLKTLIKD
ncbi:MAG TPA: hypothetical protein VHP36_01185 [Chitinispirillaceae bacterium]|nr:hypothetical protein [Chitinispirillaceae bacterium]